MKRHNEQMGTGARVACCALAVAALAALPQTGRCEPVVVLSSGSLDVTLDGAKAWTMTSLRGGGSVLLNNPGSAQGTVLRISDQWVGSAHGGETVNLTRLFINGVETPIVGGTTYAGGSLRFEKHSTLGGAYDLRATMEVDGAVIRERHTYTGLSSADDVTVFYAFLNSRVPDFDRYATFDKDLNPLTEGRIADDALDDCLHLNHVPYVGLYSTSLGLGQIVYQARHDGEPLSAKLYLRDADGKLYARLLDKEGTVLLGDSFTLEQATCFFQADLDEWTDVAAENAPVPEPAAILAFTAAMAFCATRRRSRRAARRSARPGGRG